ncbi:hypothetical protein R6Q57_026907 [Mikania cordata]
MAAPKLPPGPTNLPVIGNLHQILGKPRHESLWQLSKEYGPVMRIFVGSKQFLIISSAAMAKEILKTQDHIFCSREFFQATKRLTYNFVDIAFSPHSSHWREMRKLFVSEFMGPKRTKLSRHVLVTEMESVIRSLSSHAPSNTAEVNMSDMCLEIVKQMVCKVAFGDNYRTQPSKGPSWDVMLTETMELLNGSVGDSFPFLGFFIDWFSGWNRRLNDGFRNLDAYIDMIIDDHLKHNAGEEIKEEDKDFLHTVLDMSSKENDLGYRVNHADIKALVMDILTGGIDTTVVTMIWAMSEIIRNPRVMHKLQNEIRSYAGRIQKVDELDTTKMTYLKMVVKETMRLHTPAPLLIPHVSVSDTQIAGYDVFPGTAVLINAWGIARDPTTWGDNATEFYPERFKDQDGDFGRDRFEMLPFGGGRRSCPAMNTAPANVEFVIATLLYWFDWELPSGIKCEDLNMENGGTLVLGKKTPLYLVPTKHKSNRSSLAAPKLPPGPTNLPVIGNLHQILGKPRHESLWQLSKEYGPVMRIFIGSKQFLIISSPAMAKEILKTQDRIFCSREFFQATKRLTYNFVDIAFSPHSSHWREMRKLFVSEFVGPKRAKLSRHVLVAEMESVIRSLSSHARSNTTEVNMSDMFLEIVKQMVCKVAFGDNYRTQPSKGPSWDVMLTETTELLNGSVGDSFPFLGFFIDWFSGWNRRLNDGFRNLDAYIDMIIDDHLKHNTGEEIKEEDKDFLHTVLDMSYKENASGYRVNHADIKALVMDILTGGIDSTVVTLVWAMSEIIRNPRVMHKLQNEIRSCTKRIQKVDELDTTKMTYLKMAVKETLRLHTPAPLLIPHVSVSDTQIAGYDVFPGTTVLINAWGIARDPTIWGENATEFYPERFKDLDGDFGRDRFEMLPFGGGRRSCPAMNTAPANVEFVIATILYWFDWELPSGIKCEDLNMENGGTLILGKKTPLCLVPTEHKWED